MTAPADTVTITLSKREVEAVAICMAIALSVAERRGLTDAGLDALRHKICDAAGIDAGDLL